MSRAYLAVLGEVAVLRRQVEELTRERNEARVRYDAACDEASRLSNELNKWCEREASVCPEDFGFEEVLATLRAKAEIVDAMERREIDVDTMAYADNDVLVVANEGYYRAPTLSEAFAAYAQARAAQEKADA